MYSSLDITNDLLAGRGIAYHRECVGLLVDILGMQNYVTEWVWGSGEGLVWVV